MKLKIFKIIANFFKEVWSEMKKVSWPSRDQVVNHTAIVIISSVIAMLIISAIDLGLTKSLEYFISL